MNLLAIFKIIQQVWIVEVISYRDLYILIAMSTGAGKSTIYAFPGYVEDTGF